MLLLIFIINFLTWNISTWVILNKKNVFAQAGLLKLLIAFFISFSLISMLYVLSVYWYVSHGYFLLFLSFISLFLYLDLDLKSFKSMAPSINPSSYKSLLTVLVSLLLISISFKHYDYKWGTWDSFAIWSLHAKFLTYQNYWNNYLSNELAWSHPDYPLMLSSYVAVIWKSIGCIDAFVPSIIAFITLISVSLAGYSSLTSQNLKMPGIIFLTILTFDRRFIEISGWLNADTLLSLFVLFSFILFNHLKEGNKNILYLLGFFVAASGWVKNEGILFFTVFSLYFLVFNFKNPKNFLRYISGSVIPLLMVLTFKFMYAPQNDIMQGQSKNTFEKIMDLNRSIEVFKYFTGEFLVHYKIILIGFFILLIFSRSYFKTFSFGVLFTVLLGYFAIYIITPMDLKWHLETSCERLFHQLYPSALYSMILATGLTFKKKYPVLPFSVGPGVR